MINLLAISSSIGGRHEIDGRKILSAVAGNPHTLRKPALQALRTFYTLLFVKFQITLP